MSDTQKLDHMLQSTRDIDVLLGRLLSEAMHTTHAEGGTIYLRAQAGFRVAHVQNDALLATMRPSDIAALVSKGIQAESGGSIAGHVAATGEIIRLTDTNQLPPDASFTFDASVDAALGYRTKAMLATPLLSADGTVAGVLQLINPISDSAVFTDDDVAFARDLGRIATTALERARLERAMLLRMVRMAQLRDPTETGTHVNRVAAVSVSLLNLWAQQTNADTTWHDSMVDDLRIAAMLHDVGKVAIDDAILKKPGALDPHEYAAMQEHTVIGAALFDNGDAPSDRLAHDVALHHHQRWDGTGYPAVDINGTNRPLRGDEIPLAARLVAIADVHDALASKRAYKDAWPQERIASVLREGAGTHFDPVIAALFVDNLDSINRIRAAVAHDSGT